MKFMLTSLFDSVNIELICPSNTGLSMSRLIKQRKSTQNS